MTTLSKISELTILVNGASTATIEGRQILAIYCKELYNLIEKDIYNTDKEWMLEGIYNDLCSGDFGEPFMCEQKKTIFNTVVHIYNKRIMPFL